MKLRIQKMLEENYLYRLFAFNLILVILVTVFPQIVSFQYIRSIFENEIDNINIQTVKQISTAVDDYVLRDIVSIPALYLTPGIGNPALIYPIDNVIENNPIAIIDLIRNIDEIQSKLPYIDSIYLYYRKNNVICSANKVKFSNEPDYQDYAHLEWFDTFLKNDNNINWILSENPVNKNKVMAYVSAMPILMKKENSDVIVSVNIDIEKLNNILKEYKPGENGSLFILNGKGEIISSNINSKSLDNNELSKVATSIPKDTLNGKLTVDLDGKSSVVSYIKSQYNDWRYISVLPVGEYYKKYSLLRVIVFISIAAFLLVNILFMVFLTKKAHKPIGNEISGLKQKLEKNIPIIRHNIILSLLSSIENDPKSLEEQANVVGIELDESLFFCFTLSIGYKEQKSTHESMLLSTQLIENLKYKDNLFEIWAVVDERGFISGILKFSSETNQAEAIELLVCKIEEVIELNYKMGIGRTYNNILVQAKESYSEACEAFNFFFIKPMATKILYSELNTNTSNKNDKYVLPINEIESSLRAGDEKKLSNIIQKAVNEVTSGNYDIDYCKNLLLNIVVAMHVSVKTLGYSSSGIFECDIRQDFKNISNVVEFQGWIEGIIKTAIEKMNEQRNDSSAKMGEKIKEYIVNNLYDDLTLESLAEYVGVTPTYLSRIFKLYIGATYTEYVTEMKMHQAGILVREKNLTVNEIAEKLGYNTTHHFIKLFKAKYGMTPKQYQLYKSE